MLNERELDGIIEKSLKKILDEFNNHIDRDNYAELEKTLKEVASKIKGVLKQKGEVKNNG